MDERVDTYVKGGEVLSSQVGDPISQLTVTIGDKVIFFYSPKREGLKTWCRIHRSSRLYPRDPYYSEKTSRLSNTSIRFFPVHGLW